MKIKKYIKKYQYYIFSLFLSSIVLLFTSKNSFLYPINDWVDANAFFTVGKSIFNNVIPYRDLFEQKGLLLYFIYGLGYLISHKSFLGVFILEIISFTIFLSFAHKIFSMFLSEKYSYILLPILSYLITTSMAFVHGGSCEELCLSLFCITLYYYFKHYKKDELYYKEILINGLIAGIVFMIKYTLLGFWFGFMAFIFLDLILKKNYKKAFVSCLVFLFGMIIPISASLIYLGMNNAIKDFINCYFIINMTAYNSEKMNLGIKIVKLLTGFTQTLIDNGIKYFLGIILIPILLIKIPINKYSKISIIFILILSVLGLFWGLKFYNYYILPVYIFLIITLLGITILLKKVLDPQINRKHNYILFISITSLSIFLCYYNANYKEMLGMNKNDCFQFKFAKYINSYEKPTLLNMGYLDAGLYTTTGIVPNTRFFEVQNIDYNKFPDNLDDMKNNVINKKIDFILYYTRKDLDYIREKDSYIFENYELELSDKYIFEHDEYNAFLFKKKDL